MHIAVEQQIFGKWKECQLYCGGEAAGIGYMLAAAHHALSIEFRQAVYEVVAAVLDAVIGR